MVIVNSASGAAAGEVPSAAVTRLGCHPHVAVAVIVVAVRTRLLTVSSGESRHRSVSGNSASALITAARSFLSCASRCAGSPRMPVTGSSVWSISPNQIPAGGWRQARGG
jgi:hypothetical protein